MPSPSDGPTDPALRALREAAQEVIDEGCDSGALGRLERALAAAAEAAPLDPRLEEAETRQQGYDAGWRDATEHFTRAAEAAPLDVELREAAAATEKLVRQFVMLFGGKGRDEQTIIRSLEALRAALAAAEVVPLDVVTKAFDEYLWGLSISPGGGPCEESVRFFRDTLLADLRPPATETAGEAG